MGGLLLLLLGILILLDNLVTSSPTLFPSTVTPSSPSPSNVQRNIITTIAGNGLKGYSGDGGEATSANLQKPYVVTLDSAGKQFN